ncbi:MAG TPA: ribosome assembly RNA-binding protein YhbY [Nitrosospira sp.]|nr:ribosome assembly RNA-binding protein YhbY [Nitrosospira sp.]
MLELSSSHRATLKALSHSLKPVVWIGGGGLSEAVIRELDQALKSHELIKIKVSNDERETREALLEQICGRLRAAPIHHIGRMFVIYRPVPNEIPVENIRKTTSGATSKGKSRELIASANKDPSLRPKRKMAPRRGR